MTCQSELKKCGCKIKICKMDFSVKYHIASVDILVKADTDCKGGSAKESRTYVFVFKPFR